MELVTITASLASQPVTLDQLAALSDEMAALARAGVPLDRGLRELARDMPGRLGKLADQMGQRLAAGQPLDKAVQELSTTLPPAYRAVLTAGQRSGKLSAALEGVAHSARHISQLRQSIGLAVIYPLIVLLVAWGLLVFVLTQIAPVMLQVMQQFELKTDPWDRLVGGLSGSALWWGTLIPAAALVWLAWIWYRSGRVAQGVELHPWLGLGAIPTLVRMQRAGRTASLAELLALLVSNHVPLPEAIELASAAVGSPQMERGGKELAERLRRGEKMDRIPAGFPPLVAWTLVSGSDASRLPHVLSRTAQTYREEVARRGQWLQLYVPLVMIVGICGTVAMLYALLTLLPWILVMYRLAEPV
ncbi:MAG TPA: type II secretion system F family protein [Pirellulaceae bacterium]|nr:type II secretion system F family protein [Pirellulaceae bacterium]